jgi:hypothetical protein
MKRGRKSQVNPAQAGEWLRRHDELGETASQIARDDGYDVRTVRKKIAEAREQKEGHEARQLVIRSALEKHFAGICAFARKLRTQVLRREPVIISGDLTGDPLFRSLKEHLPRSPMWDSVNRWPGMVAAYNTSSLALRRRIEQEALRETVIPFSSSLSQQGLYEGWFDGMLAHAKLAALGEAGLNPAYYRLETTSHGIRLNTGIYTLALTSEAKVSLLQKAFNSMLEDVEKWPEYDDLRNNTEKFLAMQAVIQDELTTVILRRVVSGRCHYCPY